MSNKKNIDRLFQEKFENFEAAPSNAVWNRISNSLEHKKKKRRVIAIWWKLGGVAAVIALLLTVGVSMFNATTNSQILPIVNTDTQEAVIKKDSSVTPLLITNTHSKTNNRIEDNPNTITTNNAGEPINTNRNFQNKKAQSQNSTVANNRPVIKTKMYAQKPSKQKNRASIVGITDHTSSKLNKTNGGDLKSTTGKDLQKNSTVVNNANSTPPQIEHLNNDTKNDIKKEETEALTNPLGTKKSVIEAVAEGTKNKEKEQQVDKRSRWSIAPNVAPVYFSSLSKDGSALDNQFNKNPKSSAVNMSYGVLGSYAISNKLKVRAGVNKVNFNYTTSNVYAFTGADASARGDEAQFENITITNTMDAVSFLSSEILSRTSTPELFNTKIVGNIDQRFGFIEVPFELQYQLLDKKFGVNVIGGLSTLFLNKNEIYADIDGTSTMVGEANNINTTSFSANFGLGLDYKLSKQWHINLEPTFKYQMNTFTNTSGEFKPFFIGVYSGLSFKF